MNLWPIAFHARSVLSTCCVIRRDTRIYYCYSIYLNTEVIMTYDPNSNLVGGFSDTDGTINFYLRINSLLNEEAVVLDFGAGRAAWFEDDGCQTRRSVRLIKGRVKKVIAADIDDAVFQNRASDLQILMKHDGDLELDQHKVNLVIADYVLEHIEDPRKFVEQVDNCLESGGWFCARTPHKYSYVGIVARLLKNELHSKALKLVQPNRKEVDVFPTTYKLNTLRDVQKAFYGWEQKSYVYRSDPAYFFGNRFLYQLQSVLHRILPAFFCGNLFIFVRKPGR